MGVFLLAVLVAVLWLLRLRRRSEPVHDVEHLVVCGVVGALVIGVFGALLIRVTHAPPDAIAIIVLLVLLTLSLRPTSWYLSTSSSDGRPRRPSHRRHSPTFDACHLLDLTTTWARRPTQGDRTRCHLPVRRA